MINQRLFEIDNLDCIDDADELRELGEILRLYSRYANEKARAVEARLSGDILNARHAEIMCDTIYNEIPQQFRKW